MESNSEPKQEEKEPEKVGYIGNKPILGNVAYFLVEYQKALKELESLRASNKEKDKRIAELERGVQCFNNSESVIAGIHSLQRFHYQRTVEALKKVVNGYEGKAQMNARDKYFYEICKEALNKTL
jgi:hypothetical protein